MGLGAVGLLSLAVGCGEGEENPERLFAPPPTGISQLSLSAHGSITLLADESTACVIDSYEVRIRCVDRRGSVVGVFGREGEGPGEFGRLGGLVRGLDGTVGVVDTGSNRFTVYEPSGTWIADIALPAAAVSLNPTAPFGESVLGVSMITAAAGSGRTYTLFEVDIASAEVLRQEEIPPMPVEIQCGDTAHYGLPDPSGGWVLIACRGHLVFLGADGQAIGIQAPTYVEELPTERDVARRQAELGVLGRRARGPQVRVDWLEGYRNTPKAYHLVFGSERFDALGRLWIPTQRDTHEFSYLDVYSARDAEYVGTVRVRDRMMGFDLAGSTLVVLVERRLGPDDPDGIADRAVDWYDIGGWR